MGGSVVCAESLLPRQGNHSRSKNGTKLLDAAGKEKGTLEQASRRLDVGKEWLQETGVLATKDHMSVRGYLLIEINRKRILIVRECALKLALETSAVANQSRCYLGEKHESRSQ